MPLNEVRDGNFYQHVRTGNDYMVLALGRMKDPATGEWKDCVIYQQMLASPEVFVRELESFKERFHRVSLGQNPT